MVGGFRMSKLIKEEFDINHKKVHSDAGDGQCIKCPNCEQEVVFADCQWWRSECRCGEWKLIQKAVLYTD